MADPSHILVARGISKRFYGTQALDRVDFSLAPGEIHTLIGENGAGKSTLIKILGGVHRKDAGDVLLDGRPCDFASPRESLRAGIVVIPQEMQLVSAATVAENVTLGDWPTERWLGLLPRLDKRRMRERAAEALAKLKYRGDLDVAVGRLTFAERQLVAIAKALSQRARVLILDEPTASLEHREAERLFETLEGLKCEGVGIVFVSHRLDEVVRISDRCTTLRDGRVVDVSTRDGLDKERLVRLMTGRDLEELHRPHRMQFGEPLLEYDGGGPERGRDRSLKLRSGETVGLAGLLGSGTSAYLRDVFGAGGGTETVRLKGCEQAIGHPSTAIRRGIGLVPRERSEALVLDLSVRDNIVLPHLERLPRQWLIGARDLDRIVVDLLEALDVRPRDPRKTVRQLSGGNQQKVIFARWLMGEIAVLLLDEPTHGIDVGAKARIHRLMREFAEGGGGVLFASSEMAEVVSMSDGVMAMRRGDIVARMSREGGEYSEGVLRDALGG